MCCYYLLGECTNNMATAFVEEDKPVADDVLQCPLCLHPLETPVTLQQCLHTYCKECLDEIPQTSKDDVTGWKCPKCNRFTSEEDVKENNFIQKVVMSNKVNEKAKDRLTCKYCNGETDVKWCCTDCRIVLCSSCRVNHIKIPMLKNHVVVELDTSKSIDIVVDELLFCQQHRDRLVELNCRICETPLCLYCKMEDHDRHTSETVTNALKRLVPEIEQKRKILVEKIQHLETKVRVIKSKMEETRKCYAETRDKVHERIEYLITHLRRIESEQVEILNMKEMTVLEGLEERKLELEYQIEGSKHLINMTALTLQSSRDISLLEQLEDGLIEKVRHSSEISSEPLLIDVPYHALDTGIKAGECQAKLTSIYGRLNKIELKCKTTRDGQLLDNHYRCHNIFKISGEPTCTIDDLKRCDRISFIDGHIYVPVEGRIEVFDLDGNFIFQREVPFYPIIIKKLPNDQLIVGSLSGLHLYDSLETDADTIQLADGEYSDVDVYGDVFHALKCDTSDIVTFANYKDKVLSARNSPWFKQLSVKLDCISEPNDCNTFCRSDDIFIVSSEEDACVFLCDMKGNLLKKVMDGRVSHICGVDHHENVIIANPEKQILYSYNMKENSEKIMSVYQLPGKPYDLFVDMFGSMWVMLEEITGDENYQLAKFNPIDVKAAADLFINTMMKWDEQI